MGRLPHFGRDGILWQSRRHGAYPTVRFHPVTTDGMSGVQRAPAGPGFAAAIEAPENLEYRCEYLRLVEGQVLFFPIAGNMPYGQSLGYGKSLMDDITMDPPPGIPIDGPTPFPRATN